MRTTTTESGWKRAMLHAWLGFLLLLAFYLLSFGLPGPPGSGEKERVELGSPEDDYRTAAREPQ